MDESRFNRLEGKLDKLADAVGELRTDIRVIKVSVDDIERRTIEHDNYTERIDGRVASIENLALVPRKIFDFTWKLSLFVGVVAALITWIKS